ncbi:MULTISPECIES: TnsA-like heteromeric transposase endonuclease subunit [Kitasatospora]|uniref:TnsA-like heteromeric transposase endonuclease subunit n=1 Tax=Kitasatospora TaxID=2063 RepID=UPI000524CD53|nr:TnsA-like heteromeric transposase endonuclease subunit [Kitasatospora setae]
MIRYADASGVERLADVEAAKGVDFENALPIRAIPSYAGQRHTPGTYWSASGDRHVRYESHLESRWLKIIDQAPDTAVFVSQAMELSGNDRDGSWRHVPDIWVRRVDGSVRLVDVKAAWLLDRPDVVRQRDRTALVCERLGWDYEMVGEPDKQIAANVEWLAGYRRPLGAGAALVQPLLSLAAQPVSIAALTGFQAVPELARSVVFHLMWGNRLSFDITRPIRDTTLVRAQEHGGDR